MVSGKNINLRLRLSVLKRTFTRTRVRDIAETLMKHDSRQRGVYCEWLRFMQIVVCNKGT